MKVRIEITKNTVGEAINYSYPLDTSLVSNLEYASDGSYCIGDVADDFSLVSGVTRFSGRKASTVQEVKDLAHVKRVAERERLVNELLPSDRRIYVVARMVSLIDKQLNGDPLTAYELAEMQAARDVFESIRNVHLDSSE